VEEETHAFCLVLHKYQVGTVLVRDTRSQGGILIGEGKFREDGDWIGRRYLKDRKIERGKQDQRTELKKELSGTAFSDECRAGQRTTSS
jgi:hypothetical protein